MIFLLEKCDVGHYKNQNGRKKEEIRKTNKYDG